jgi:hypothetical protein
LSLLARLVVQAVTSSSRPRRLAVSAYEVSLVRVSAPPDVPAEQCGGVLQVGA